MSRRILWVTDEAPDKNLGGGSIRQYHLLRNLTKYVEVDLVVAGKVADDGLRASLGRIVELSHPPPLAPTLRGWFAAHQSLLPWRVPSDLTGSKRLLEVIRPALGDTESYDLVHVEHEQLGALLGSAHSNSWVIAFQNLLSVRLQQWRLLLQTRRGRFLAQRDVIHARRFEQQIVECYDLAIAVSDVDAKLLGGRAVVVPNGVDLQRFRLTGLPLAPRLLLSASFNWLPNAEGAKWFCEHVFPLVRAQVADVRLLLVGREPDETIRRLGDAPGVEAHFDVPSVVPYLEASRVAIVPLRIGSGTRLKALEAMASGRPLAGTNIGLEGLGLQDGESAAIADEPAELADRIVELCRDAGHASRLAEAARELAATRFSWDRVVELYVEHITPLIDGLPATPTTGSRP